MKNKAVDPVPCGPSIYLDDMKLPEIKGWDVGKSYEVTIKIKMLSMTESEDSQSASFEITEINGKKLGEKSYNDLLEEEDEPTTETEESEGEE